MAVRSKPARVAPLWHSLGLLILLLAISAGFFHAQTARPAAIGPGSHSEGNTALYLAIIASEWLLWLYVWLGGRCEGATPVRDLIGGRWSTMKSVLLDVVVAAGFWLGNVFKPIDGSSTCHDG